VGTRPSHAASYRSFLNSWAEPIMATAASAVMGPTPMIARRRTQRSSKRTAAPPLSSSVGPKSSDSDIARVAIFEIFDKELRLGRPPDVREALGRLRASGCAEDEARRLIACVLASEVYAVVRDVQKHDSVKYANALRALPEFPWDQADCRWFSGRLSVLPAPAKPCACSSQRPSALGADSEN
jgi:hypothetical protein